MAKHKKSLIFECDEAVQSTIDHLEGTEFVGVPKHK